MKNELDKAGIGACLTCIDGKWVPVNSEEAIHRDRFQSIDFAKPGSDYTVVFDYPIDPTDV